jgi:asparagine synthase (glutamine-hydrolysing)
VSGIAGIVHLDGRPVGHRELAAMTATMAHRGPDGTDWWRSGSIGFGHCMLRTTAQARHEVQPLSDADGGLCLTLDGRVDNRAEIGRDLAGARHYLRDGSDAELVLQAYRRWGRACIARLIGDFAFALWDGTRRELICGRDFHGKRPFYYYLGRSSFRFASEPQAVMADPRVPREPNQGMIGEYLANAVTSTTETLFRDLMRLPAAHYLVLGPGGMEVSRYWEWDPEHRVRYADDRDYAAHLRDLLASVTEVQVQSPWPVGAELSGGVDSSSVVGLVTHLQRVGRYDGNMDAYSMFFPGRACDESTYIREVASHCGIGLHTFVPRPAGDEPYIAQSRRYLDLSNYPTMLMCTPHLAAAKNGGCRVLLTGHGGDEWLDGTKYAYADYLRHLSFGPLITDFRDSVDRWGWKSALIDLRYYGIKPLLPAAVVEFMQEIRRREQLPWLKPEFCRAVGLKERIHTTVPTGPDHATYCKAMGLVGGFELHQFEFVDRYLASLGVEYRHPLSDRRIVEFALAIPESQRRRGEMTKHAFRAAVAGLIPESVRTRWGKADFSHVFYDELKAQGGSRLFHHMDIEELGWVDARRLRAMYERVGAWYRCGRGPDPTTTVWPLWLTLAVERWLQVV